MARYLASLAAGDSVVIAARLVSADFAGDERLGWRGAVAVCCSVLLLCTEKTDPVTNFLSGIHLVLLSDI